MSLPWKNVQNSPFDDAVVIAMGSNIRGNFNSSLDILNSTVSHLPKMGFSVVQRSPWWRSPAWPDPGEPEYLNGIVLVETGLVPQEALAALLQIERHFGRERSVANAARTLDLDMIAYGRLVIDEPNLRLPHPRSHERKFVMGPLAQIAPNWRHPVTGQSASALARLASIGVEAEPVGKS